MSLSSDVVGSLNGLGELKTFCLRCVSSFTTHKTDCARQTGREAQTQPTHVNPALSDDVRNKIGSV